jgi:hypothetical protein
MTSVFQVIAHEDSNDQTKLRQAMALASERVNDRFGSFVRQGSVDDQAARYSLIEDDLTDTVIAACDQVGVGGNSTVINNVLTAIRNNFVTGDAAPQLRTASVRHEARKPKMCPYHSEVTDISLAQGEPQAGFNAMAQHAWGSQHCQGEGYKGDKCKFKPAMTTQSYWDERSEKLEEKRQERAEREEQEALRAEQQVNELPEVETPKEPVAESAPSDTLHDGFEGGEPVAEAPQEIPMSMAAKTASPTTGLGEAIPKMDKRKWTPKTVPHDQPLNADKNGPNPTRRKDIIEPILPKNRDDLDEIGKGVTERQDVTQKSEFSKGDQGGSQGTAGGSAVSSLLDPNSVKQALAKFKRN